MGLRQRIEREIRAALQAASARGGSQVNVATRVNRVIQQGIDWVAHSGKDFATMSSQLDNLSWAYCYVVQRAVHVNNVCGAAPFDHRQVEEHN